MGRMQKGPSSSRDDLLPFAGAIGDIYLRFVRLLFVAPVIMTVAGDKHDRLLLENVPFEVSHGRVIGLRSVAAHLVVIQYGSALQRMILSFSPTCFLTKS